MEVNTTERAEMVQCLLNLDDEFIYLRQRNEDLSTKAAAFDALLAVINRLGPEKQQGASVDVTWQIRSMLEKLKTKDRLEAELAELHREPQAA